jgi:hypothetical protein
MNRTLALSLAVAAACAALGAQTPSGITTDAFKGLPLRSPPDITTGRISDIDIDPKNPNVWYVARLPAVSSKPRTAATHSPRSSTGRPYCSGRRRRSKNSNIVWLGTGENNNQRSVGSATASTNHGRGNDLEAHGARAFEHIQNIVIDPRNSSVVYVTAIGPLWTSGGDRGLYRTTDGGATWKAVLTVSPDTGATDLVIDPKKPDTLYVAMQRRRQVGQLIGGGSERYLQSTDGGAKWTKLTKGSGR